MEWLAQAGLSNALVATLLAVLAATVGTFARRPALTHGLWLLVLIKLVTPPIAPVALRPPRSELAPVMANAPAEQTIEWTPRPDEEAIEEPAPDAIVDEKSGATIGPSDHLRAIRPSLLAAWAAGALGWWGLAGWRIVRFRRMLREAQPADDDLSEQVRVIADRLGMKRCPRIALVPGRVPPLVWSIGGVPLLILPELLWKGLEPEARESLLTHELAHLRRRDHWTRWLELWTGGLYWWHPVVWWARRALREAEELCCDAWVVAARPEAARTYARALMTTLDFLSQPRPATPLGASGIGHVSGLKRRMTMIVRAQTPKALSWRGRLAVLALGATLLPLTPTWAQRDDAPKDATPAPEAPAREEAPAPKPPTATAHDRFEQYRRALERLGISDERIKQQLDEAVSQMQRAFEAGAMSEEGIRRALDQARRDVDQSLERGRLAQRERLDAGEVADSTDREVTSDHRVQVEKTRAEIRELQAKLRQAENRLDALEGRSRVRIRVVPPSVRSRTAEPPHETAQPGVAPNGGIGPGPGREPGVPGMPPGRRQLPNAPGGDAGLPRAETPRPDFRTRGGVRSIPSPAGEDTLPRAEMPAGEPSTRAPGVPEQRVRQLEEKLETLLKEMQSLKSELRGTEPKQKP